MSYIFRHKTINCLLFSSLKVQPIRFCGVVHNLSVNVDEGPLKILKQKILDGELMNDGYQMKVVENLQNVYAEVYQYQPNRPGLLDKWFRRDKKQKPPKGLYLYGAVGGGKTMLMDLFYDCCQVLYLYFHASIAHGEP